MKYLSLDLETSSLVRNPDNIITASFVLEDSDNIQPVEHLPALNILFTKLEGMSMQAVALAMNQRYLVAMALSDGMKPDYLATLLGHDLVEKAKGILNRYDTVDCWHDFDVKLRSFLDAHGLKKPILAGKNVGTFDLQFFYPNVQDLFDYRVIDAGARLLDFKKDKKIPSLATCLNRAGFGANVAHDSYEDALDVIRVLRTTY